MKTALLCVTVLCAVVAVARAQDYYYGAGPAPSMYAQQAGQQVSMGAAPFVNEMGQPIPAAPSMDAIMAGSQMHAPYMQQQQMMEPSPAAFVEQPQYGQVNAAAPYFNTQEAVEEEADTENAVAADESESEETESESEEETESEDSEETSDESRFQQVEKKRKKKGGKKANKRLAKKGGKKGKKAGKKAKKAAVKKAKKAGKKSQKSGQKDVQTEIGQTKKQ